MYFDDFTAQQTLKTKDPWSLHPINAPRPAAHPFHALWGGVGRLVRGRRVDRGSPSSPDQ
ncbi:hypothetical protein [Nocardioides albertanoniae]|uniref:hypothetical protein n=1 Tax=Nocardioides albertanoniae TaxID=1175486 RepID=UPI00114D50D7|nr:hypothetical protein [Nocardioides albertanoniae]